MESGVRPHPARVQRARVLISSDRRVVQRLEGQCPERQCLQWL